MLREKQKSEQPKPEPKKEPVVKTITKTVTLIFRRGGADKDMIKKIRDIIVLTVKRLGKESVYMKIKAANPDPTTLTLTFSDFPKAEEKLIVDIIQVLGRSGLGITKATME